MKKVLIIQGNPIANSYGPAGRGLYEGAAESGAEVRELVLSELEFDLNLSGGYKGKQPLEPDLQKRRN